MIRCYVSVGSSQAVEDIAETDGEQARYTASCLADIYAGVVVFDPEGGVVVRFGDVPEPF
ncbi:hypothetical protein [Aureimonas leprariae]|uniref:Uncharacterized protein n=1 Tax=Plantimonas leprariae TaxID=2615207 RepID=A0A7V7PKU2_9HYPH|nr:hypothetical protein [Aureimonas leprariae]KAB0676392.1 hypothetical protein F6X38_21075 [Aureimonas leprariae]